MLPNVAGAHWRTHANGIKTGNARKTSLKGNYKFTNPVSKKIEPKSMYCEKLDDSVVCGGVYK